ncbi:MAG: D-alanyl-D-alanine carboxypeptidase/D-alanyl-D-alanine-endopeptidase [Halothiobacillaceae bacterium]
MNTLKRLLAFLLLLPLAHAAYAADFTAYAELPAEVEDTLLANNSSPTTLGIWVQAVNSDTPLLSWNADRPQNPASVMKLVTTAAALDILGANYTWPTEVFVSKPVINGVLKGDIILKGYGNPMFFTEDLAALIQDLRKKGLHTIDGNLVLDNSFFSLPLEDPAAFDNAPYRAYNALPDALLLNQRATRFMLSPDPASRRLNIQSELPIPGMRIANNVKTSKKAGCADPKVDVISTSTETVIEFSGNLNPNCGEKDMYRVVVPPENMLLGAFSSMWAQQGGSFNGNVRVAPTPAKAQLYYTYQSRPLADIIIPMNKLSSNVMARQLLLSVAAKKLGAPATPEKGKRAIDLWLTENKLSWPGFELGNGSGLSREARISPRQLGDLLMHVYRSPTMLEFSASLPIVGIDGTVRKRLKDEDIQGRAQLKTGTLNGTRAIAGFMYSRSGQAYIVAVLHNEPGVQLGVGSKVQDAVLQWVYEQP